MDGNMTKQGLLEKAETKLNEAIEKQSLPLYTIRDIIETIKTLRKQDYCYTLYSDTKSFFKKMGFKVNEISTYYEITF